MGVCGVERTAVGLLLRRRLRGICLLPGYAAVTSPITLGSTPAVVLLLLLGVLVTKLLLLLLRLLIGVVACAAVSTLAVVALGLGVLLVLLLVLLPIAQLSSSSTTILLPGMAVGRISAPLSTAAACVE